MGKSNKKKHLYLKKPAQLKLIFSYFKHNFFVLVVLCFAFFFRVYRINKLLGFWYDQGRDALVIWDLLHNGKFFLIGPTTGIAGIFRGPWYYWLITPAYFLGSGNPVFPSVFLSLLVVLSIWILYLLGKKVGNRWTGTTALVLGAFSYSLIMSSRWLSNPTPMFLISVLFVWSLFKVFDGSKWWLYASGLIGGFAMQFGSATEVFYLPVLFMVLIFFARKLLTFKNILIVLLAFVLPFIPQILFDIRHNGILTKGIYEFLFAKGSFKLSFWEVVKIRLPFYYEVFATKILPQKDRLLGLIISFSFLVFILKSKKLIKNIYFLIVSILFVVPLLGMLFFQGNEGNVYDYYFTGYYFVFLIMFAAIITLISDKFFGKLMIICFLFLFLFKNIPPTKGYIESGFDGVETINLKNELDAVNWVFDMSAGRNFNYDTYVPPVIFYAYDYLYLWQGTKRCGGSLCGLTRGSELPLLYTIYEVDPPHPERLEAWLVRQKKIGEVVSEKRFGGIVAQERRRISDGQ